MLVLWPRGELCTSRVGVLTQDAIETGITARWWHDPALKDRFDEPPFDRAFDWQHLDIEYDGRIIPAQTVGITTLDGYVQGAMLVSTEPIDSALPDPGGGGATTTDGVLVVELLFTAPRNRPALRRDGARYISGVGPELLTWAVNLSQKMGCRGRLRLDASPDYVAWYGRLGFDELPLAPVEAQGTEFIPMELPAATVPDFLAGRRRALTS